MNISKKLGDAVALTAWHALARPESMSLTYACKRLLAEAAFGEPLCRDAAATVLSIAADILEAGEHDDASDERVAA